MDFGSMIAKKLDKNKALITSCFWQTLAMTVLAIAFCMIRGFSGMNNQWTFSVGADIFCLAICSMMCLSCMQAHQDGDEYTRIFVTLLTTNGWEMFLDICCWTVQDIPSLRLVNITVNVMYYAGSALLTYFFWRYVNKVLEVGNRFAKIANNLLNLLLIPTVLLCVSNFFVPLYFSVDNAGVYTRREYFFISQLYLAVGLVAVGVSFIMSRVRLRTKLVTGSFVLIPLINQLLTRYTFGISTSYCASMVSIVLIYGVLFAEQENKIVSTSKELGLATRIQSDMLPNNFPAFPERKEFDVFASMNPAKEVGGDFYDFFLIDEENLGIVIADVSGKGIPAALFMMASKILLQNASMNGKTPEETLRTVNEQICSNNREEMFVTVWLGVLNLRTGLLTAANAGHEYPIICSPESGFRLYKDRHGFVIGGIAGVKYRQYEIQLVPGSKIFIYTDGVPEATNAANELFGTDRLLEALNSVKDGAPREILDAVNSAVSKFVGDSDQFDDLTMLCLQYKGKEDGTHMDNIPCGVAPEEITLPAKTQSIEAMTEFVDAILDENECPKKAKMQLNVAIDEIVCNIANYAYGKDGGEVTLRVNVTYDPHGVTLTFIDSGTPYDPLKKPDPDTSLSAEERQIGGLGIFLVKKTMDDMTYEFTGGQNILTLRKYF